jgi:hypothetical protein
MMSPRTNNVLAAAVLVFGLIAGAGAAQAEGGATLLGMRFPARVASFAFQDTTDYESRSAGGGYSAKYLNGREWADVYVYTLGRSNIPQTYESGFSKTQYEQAASVIPKAAQMGAYRSAKPLKAFSLPARGTPRFDCGRFAIVSKEGQANDSVLCVTNRNGKFIKVRLSGPKGSLTNAEVSGFITPWLRDF